MSKTYDQRYLDYIKGLGKADIIERLTGLEQRLNLSLRIRSRETGNVYRYAQKVRLARLALTGYYPKEKCNNFKTGSCDGKCIRSKEFPDCWWYEPADEGRFAEKGR